MAENLESYAAKQRGGRGYLAILVIATLYFLFVLAMGINLIAIPALQNRIRIGDLVLAGSLLFAAFVVVLIVMLARRAEATTAERSEEEARLVESAHPPASREQTDEFIVTSDTFQGLKVVEYSHPPKSLHRGAIYAKAYVPVGKGSVLRVEELIAEERE